MVGKLILGRNYGLYEICSFLFFGIFIYSHETLIVEFFFGNYIFFEDELRNEI